MAIYHLTVRGGTRARGTVAARKSDYIRRENCYEKQPDRCLHRESGNLPEWAESGRDFWRAADRFERANGRLFVEVEVALPRELSEEKQVELARAFARDLAGERHPYTLAVHEGGGHNPHAHLMMSERTNDGIERSPARYFSRADKGEPERGGALKSREFHGGEKIEAVRERWAGRVNEALEQEGSRERVSHKSLEAQGIDRLPGRHIGPRAMALEEKGVATERGEMALAVERLNRELALERAAVLAERQGLERVVARERGLDY